MKLQEIFVVYQHGDKIGQAASQQVAEEIVERAYRQYNDDIDVAIQLGELNEGEMLCQRIQVADFSIEKEYLFTSADQLDCYSVGINLRTLLVIFQVEIIPDTQREPKFITNCFREQIHDALIRDTLTVQGRTVEEAYRNGLSFLHDLIVQDKYPDDAELPEDHLLQVLKDPAAYKQHPLNRCCQEAHLEFYPRKTKPSSKLMCRYCERMWTKRDGQLEPFRTPKQLTERPDEY